MSGRPVSDEAPSQIPCAPASPWCLLFAHRTSADCRGDARRPWCSSRFSFNVNLRQETTAAQHDRPQFPPEGGSRSTCPAEAWVCLATLFFLSTSQNVATDQSWGGCTWGECMHSLVCTWHIQTQAGAFSGGRSNSPWSVERRRLWSEPEPEHELAKKKKHSWFFVGRISKSRAVVEEGRKRETGIGWVRKHKCAFNNTPSSCHYLFSSLGASVIWENRIHTRSFCGNFQCNWRSRGCQLRPPGRREIYWGWNSGGHKKTKKKKRFRCFRKMSKAEINLHFGFSTWLLKDFQPLWEWQLEFFWQHLPPFLPHHLHSPTAPHSQDIIKYHIRVSVWCWGTYTNSSYFVVYG